MKASEFLEFIDKSKTKMLIGDNFVYGFKTVLDLPKHKGLTVEDVIKIDKTYLSWCNENLEKVTFSNKVLDLL